jgi:chromosome segregation ATPase
MPEKKTEKSEYEENVITPEDFEKLEEKETKKKFLGFARKEKEEKEKPKEEKSLEPREKTPLDALTLKVEKLGGKIESLEEIRHTVDERFSRLSEEIGELRSSILEKDRAFDKVEAGFNRMEEIVEELEPTKLRKELDKKSEGIVKNQAKIEALSLQIKELSKTIKGFRDMLGKIKDVKNLVNISNEMTKIFTNVQQERRTINKTAGKIETIFSELSRKVSEFDSYKDKVDFNAETMHDLMKSLDMLEVKLEDVLKKEDMGKIDERIKKMETEVKDNVQDIKDIVNMLISSLKRTNLREIIEKQGIESVGSINDRISQLQKRLEAVEGLAGGLGSVQNDIESLRRSMDSIKTKAESVEKEERRVVTEEKVVEERRVTDALSDMIAYVRNCLSLGYTTKQIKEELLEKGWPRRTINEILLREVIRMRKEARAKESSESSRLGMKEMVVSPTP